MYQSDKLTNLLPSKPSYLPEPDATGRIFLEAAHLIRTHGHARYYLKSDAGYCLHGAVEKTRLGDTFDGNACDYGHPVHHRLCAALDAQGVPTASHDGLRFACTWNNHPLLTADEVIAALEEAAFWEPV